MTPVVEQDQDHDSDSSSCDVECFGAVCDPSLEGVYLKTKDVNVEESIAPIECVTGDADVDCALRDVKKACRTFTRSRNLASEIPSVVPRLAQARTSGPSYLLSLANNLLEKRVLVQANPSHQPESSSATTNVPVAEDDHEEEFQLLRDVAVSSRADDGTQHQVTPTWLRKLQRRHGFSFFHPDEEEYLEDRCKDVAISAEFIANRGLAIPYAEHRNVNPKKLIRIKVTSTSDQRTGNTKKSKSFSSAPVDADVMKDKAPGDIHVKEGSRTPEKSSKIHNQTHELQGKEQNMVILSESTSSKKKKKKARKRAPKKGHKKAKLSETINGM